MGSYLEDRRLHLVAAPGSGKTVLGLEIVRRIDQSTLVLAPTITIRNQWIERLLELFLPDGTRPDWVSTDLRKPAVFTVSTYQALHALYSGSGDSESDEEEKQEAGSAAEGTIENGQGECETKEIADDLPEPLRNAKFRTLVVDEAHHLRTVLASLQSEGLIDQPARDFVLSANRNEDGTVFCGISGGTGKEQALYLRAVRELLDPVGNPRYLLARKRFWRIFREDYFAVPELLARKREFAEVFAKNWRKFVGPVDLIYTRTPEGRQILLRARMHSLAAAFQQCTERVSCWK